MNLIDNAGKASKQGDVIEIFTEDNTITVKDHGKGIPEYEISKINSAVLYGGQITPAKRREASASGLALATEIARLHGARLEFESEPGKGTTVKVVFENA